MYKTLLIILLFPIISFAGGMLKDKYFIEARVYITDMNKGPEANRDAVLERWINLQLKEYGMIANTKTPKENIIYKLVIESEFFSKYTQTIYAVKIKAYNYIGNDKLSTYPIMLFYEDINYGLLNGGDLSEEAKVVFKSFLKDWVSQNSK
jgi:hypothetical protein